MQTLFENKRKVVSREKLMKHLWETDCFVDENTLTVNVTRLRKKLASIGIEELIATKKGIGYMVE
jgi:DNA-binding response OmpR family regulator